MAVDEISRAVRVLFEFQSFAILCVYALVYVKQKCGSLGGPLVRFYTRLARDGRPKKWKKGSKGKSSLKRSKSYVILK